MLSASMTAMRPAIRAVFPEPAPASTRIDLSWNVIAAQRAVARREALESGLRAAQGAFGLLSECAFATEVSVTGDGETMHAYYVPLGIITAMSEAFGTDRWVPFLIEHGFVASEEEYAMLAKEAE